MNRAENLKEWTKKIAEFKKSGKAKEEWCKKKNISLKQFNYWQKQVSEEKPETQWIPVEISPEQKELKTVSPLNIKIGAASIEVYPCYDKEFLLEILKILQSL